MSDIRELWVSLAQDIEDLDLLSSVNWRDDVSLEDADVVEAADRQGISLVETDRDQISFQAQDKLSDKNHGVTEKAIYRVYLDEERTSYLVVETDDTHYINSITYIVKQGTIPSVIELTDDDYAIAYKFVSEHLGI